MPSAETFYLMEMKIKLCGLAGREQTLNYMEMASVFFRELRHSVLMVLKKPQQKNKDRFLISLREPGLKNWDDVQ
jgi:hypothetical protein